MIGPALMNDRFHEHDFLRWLRDRTKDERRLIVPIGDDAAVIRRGEDPRQVLALDTVVGGVHAFEGPGSETVLARKVVLANLSDLAAMGARPEAALLSLKLTPHTTAATARLILETVLATSERYGLVLAGGDTVRGPGPLVLTLAVTGILHAEPIMRSGAKPGDLIVVTGSFGGSLLAKHADFVPRLEEARLLVELGPPAAMADVSDGLLRDLANIATLSGCGAKIDPARVPIAAAARELSTTTGRPAIDHALHDGEDFELVFALPEGRWRHLESLWSHPTPLTVIGEFVERGLWVDENGCLREVAPGGYDHGGSP